MGEKLATAIGYVSIISKGTRRPLDRTCLYHSNRRTQVHYTVLRKLGSVFVFCIIKEPTKSPTRLLPHREDPPYIRQWMWIPVPPDRKFLTAGQSDSSRGQPACMWFQHMVLGITATDVDVDKDPSFFITLKLNLPHWYSLTSLDAYTKHEWGLPESCLALLCRVCKIIQL